jgi:TM2 domain-containing membrane protein YozV
MANAILAAVLSFLVPGLGQIYAGNTKNGILYVILTIIMWVIVYFTTGIYGLISRVVDFIYSIYMAYDAYKLAK